MDADLRTLRSMQNYAQANGFEPKLDTILGRAGGERLVAIKNDPTQAQPNDQTIVGRGVKVASKQLEREIQAGRKGPRPISKPIDYTFQDKEGKQLIFRLDPNRRARELLRHFESILNRMPENAADALYVKFMPTFNATKRELENPRWGWAKEDIPAAAVLITIQKICDSFTSPVRESLIESVEKKIAYWVSKRSTVLEPGSSVPPTNPKNRSLWTTDAAEQFLEEQRQKFYPDKPSRIGARFVCSDLSSAKKWLRTIRGAMIYEVEVDGNTHIADGEAFSQLCVELMQDGGKPPAENEADQYWRMYKGIAERYWTGEIYSSIPEMIVQGAATIKRLVTAYHTIKFMIRDIVEKGPNATRAIVVFLDGPAAGKMGDYAVMAPAEKGQTYVGKIEDVDLRMASVMRSSGKIEDVDLAEGIDLRVDRVLDEAIRPVRGYWIAPNGTTLEVRKTHGDMFMDIVNAARAAKDPVGMPIPMFVTFRATAKAGYVRVVKEPVGFAKRDNNGHEISFLVWPTQAQVDALLKIFPPTNFSPVCIDIDVSDEADYFWCRTFEELFEFLTSGSLIRARRSTAWARKLESEPETVGATHE